MAHLSSSPILSDVSSGSNAAPPIAPQVQAPDQDYYVDVEQATMAAAKKLGIQVTCYGESEEKRKLFMLSSFLHPCNPTLMIIAGTHGDEPAPVLAAIRSLPHLAALRESLNFIVYPCLNPD
jgi:hypothetical protein